MESIRTDVILEQASSDRWGIAVCILCVVQKNLSKVFTIFCLGGRVQYIFSFPEIFYGIPFWNWQHLIKQSMPSLPGNRCNNYHIKFPFLYSAVLFPISSGWIKKRAPLPLRIPLCLAGKRHRIQSCEKPRAPFNWRLTRLVTSVAGKPLLCKCGRWRGLNLGMHVHAYAHTFLSSLQKLWHTQEVGKDLGWYWKHQKAYSQNWEARNRGRELHRHNANSYRTGSAVRL